MLIWVLLLSFATIYYFLIEIITKACNILYPFEGDLCTCIYLPRLCRTAESTALLCLGLVRSWQVCLTLPHYFSTSLPIYYWLGLQLLQFNTSEQMKQLAAGDETNSIPGQQWIGIVVWGLRSLSNNKVDYCICKQTSPNLGEPLQQRVSLIVCWNLQCYNNLEFAKLMNNNAILLAIKINDSCYNKNIWLAQKDDD